MDEYVSTCYARLVLPLDDEATLIEELLYDPTVRGSLERARITRTKVRSAQITAAIHKAFAEMPAFSPGDAIERAWAMKGLSYTKADIKKARESHLRYVSTTVLQNHRPEYNVLNDTYCTHRPALYPEPDIHPSNTVERKRFYLQKARACSHSGEVRAIWGSEELEHAFPA